MRSIFSRLITVCSLLLSLFAIAAGQTAHSSEAVQLLPKTVGDFRALAVRPLASLPKGTAPEDFGVLSQAEGAYVSPKGEKLTVAVIKTQSQSGAYALLTEASAQIRSDSHEEVRRRDDIGTVALMTSNRVAFFKGSVFVSITSTPAANGESSMPAFAAAFAQTLEEAGNKIPDLVKHLPDWEIAQGRAVYAVSLHALQETVGNQAVLDVINFDQGTEAITANYDATRLVIVEYATPQIAESSDARIAERIKQLRESKQPAPSAYKRIGNYSVFVFDAPDDVVAANLINNVKYEQRIQWLGENPFAFEVAQQQHTQKAASLILGIAKTIGFFVAICLGAGGVVGGIAYLHRRSQARVAAETYSDAGGMLRLNLDEMTPETDPARLLGSGDGETALRS